MKKARPDPKNPTKPTQAIVTPVAHDPKSGITYPGEQNVLRAKEFVEENQK